MATIQKQIWGTPLETGAVVEKIPPVTGNIPGWATDPKRNILKRALKEGEIVYGLGETLRGINKRGWLYVSNNADEPHHEEGKHSLYASHNFLILDPGAGEKCSAVFLDYPGEVRFDIGYTKADCLEITWGTEKSRGKDPVEGTADIKPAGQEESAAEADEFEPGAELYFFEGDTPEEIVKALRKLTGRSYIPPLWAFGYGQSRWGYENEADIREVEKGYADLNIPLDMIYMDIDYMQDYKDFTVNPERFPEFPSFVAEMKEKGIRLIPIIDAGVKIQKGYDVYEEGVEKDFFCKKKDGQNLVAAVWPGKVHFPDFLNEEAAKWFGDKYAVLTDAGIEGFWNDMNEPAIFYTEDHLKEVFGELETIKDKELDIWGFFGFQELMGSLSNNPEDYRRFYHTFHGIRVRHDKVHNLYGFYMTRAAGEAFGRNIPDKRILLFSRASYIGMHRYAGVWTGDNMSWWSHLLLNIKQMPSLNMTGFLYSGADLGGFGCDTTEDLVLRWLQFGIFTPLFRNHSALGTRCQELYRFEKREAFRHIIELRYALIPYIYSEYMKAALGDEMYFKPLSFGYRQDERCREIEDQLLVGESLMIAPVYQQNTTGRYVYLPEKMKLLRFRSFEDHEEEILEAGDHYVKASLEEVVIFLRPGHVLPLCRPARHVQDLDLKDLTYICFEAAPEAYDLYTDDGISVIRQ